MHVTEVSYLGSQPWPFPRSLMVGFAARAEPGAATARRGTVRSRRRTGSTGRPSGPMIAAEDPAEADNWAAPAAESRTRRGSAFEVMLPGPVSIARRMIEGWVAPAT